MSYSRVQALIKELELIKSDCLGTDEANSKSNRQVNEFFGIKQEIILKLDEIAKNIKERNDMMDKYGRTRQTIQLTAEIGKDVDYVKERTNKLLHKFDKDKNRFLNKLSDEEIESRQKVVDLMVQMVKDIETYNTTRGKTMGAASNRIASQAKADNEKDRKKEREERAIAIKNNKKGTAKNATDEELEMASMSNEDQQFIQQAVMRDSAIDAKLDLVLQNMIVLRDLSSTIHDELLVQSNMIDSIDKKVDNVVGKFKVANNKMKELLEESGGATRWCPIIIFIIIIVALVGYILSAKGIS